jgi:hypothetical protein
MNKVLIALFAAATLAIGIAASSGAGLVSDFVAGAIGGSAAEDTQSAAYVAAPQPGYINYSYAAALPRQSCYWTRMPVYDSNERLIGWRGRPVAVCPE